MGRRCSGHASGLTTEHCFRVGQWGVARKRTGFWDSNPEPRLGFATCKMAVTTQSSVEGLGRRHEAPAGVVGSWAGPCVLPASWSTGGKLTSHVTLLPGWKCSEGGSSHSVSAKRVSALERTCEGFFRKCSDVGSGSEC